MPFIVKIYSTILALATATLFGGCYAASSPLVLAQQGRSNFTILHAADAPDSVRKAALELQDYIEKSTGAKLPIVSGEARAHLPVIALGETMATRAAGINISEVPLEGFRILNHEGNLFIAGLDTPNGETTLEGGTSTGTLNGVYTFIEDYLDVRWVLPGPLGEDVPAKPEVVLPAIDRLEYPAFQNRRVPGIQNERPAVQEWSARQKLGYSLRLEHSHNWQKVVPASLHAQHPDWFPEVDGRHPPVTGDRYKLETTNPELVQHYAQAAIDAFHKDAKLTVFSLSPTDSDGWSSSVRSRELQERDPRGRLSVTPLVIRFYNDVAKIVGREFPNRKLAGYIYASYLYPPKAGVSVLEPNLFLVVAPSISYGYQLYRDGVQEEWDGILQAWSSQTSRIAYYDLFNWLKGSAGAITPPAPAILNFAFPRLLKYGIKGVYVYGTSEWSQAAVNNYALARMAWNPQLNADALCDEFYVRAFGKAASAPVRNIYHLVDDAVKGFYNRDLTANYTATPRYQSEVLAANYPRIEALYLEARRVAGNSTPAQRARLDFFGDNLIIMQWQLRSAGFIPDAPSSPLHRTDAEVDAMLSRLHPGFGVELAPRMKRPEQAFPPVSVTRSPALAHARPATSMGLRGKTRFLCFPDADQDIRITATKVAKSGTLLRYDAYTSAGARVSGGLLKVGAPALFLGSAGQLYYVEINGGASYDVEITGAPSVLAVDAEPKGLHLSGSATPLYFQVPPGVREFTVSVTSDAPGETSLSQLYGPDGHLAATLDTQKESLARASLSPESTGGAWEGFWCLVVGKAPSGAFDDVYVVLDPKLPPWFTLDPIKPLVISSLKTLK